MCGGVGVGACEATLLYTACLPINECWVIIGRDTPLSKLDSSMAWDLLSYT